MTVVKIKNKFFPVLEQAHQCWKRAGYLLHSEVTSALQHPPLSAPPAHSHGMDEVTRVCTGKDLQKALSAGWATAGGASRDATITQAAAGPAPRLRHVNTGRPRLPPVRGPGWPASSTALVLHTGPHGSGSRTAQVHVLDVSLFLFTSQ